MAGEYIYSQEQTGDAAQRKINEELVGEIQKSGTYKSGIYLWSRAPHSVLKWRFGEVFYGEEFTGGPLNFKKLLGTMYVYGRINPNGKIKCFKNPLEAYEHFKKYFDWLKEFDNGNLRYIGPDLIKSSASGFNDYMEGVVNCSKIDPMMDDPIMGGKKRSKRRSFKRRSLKRLSRRPSRRSKFRRH